MEDSPKGELLELLTEHEKLACVARDKTSDYRVGLESDIWSVIRGAELLRKSA